MSTKNISRALEALATMTQYPDTPALRELVERATKEKEAIERAARVAVDQWEYHGSGRDMWTAWRGAMDTMESIVENAPS